MRKITEVVHRMTGVGATLNALHEVDRAALSVIDVDAQLYKMRATSPPQAA
jgi:hypothetical protein